MAKVSLEDMQVICPDCANEMIAKSLTELELDDMTVEKAKKKGDKGMSTKDPGLFTRCMQTAGAQKASDPAAYCAAVHKKISGMWPGEHGGANPMGPEKKSAIEQKHLPNKHAQADHAGGRGDTRVSFDNLRPTAKPESWREIRAVKYSALSEDQKRALASKPALELDSLIDPWSSHPGLKEREGRVGSEYHATRGGEHYYVNTEGYDYPRYILRIEGYEGGTLKSATVEDVLTEIFKAGTSAGSKKGHQAMGHVGGQSEQANSLMLAKRKKVELRKAYETANVAHESAKAKGVTGDALQKLFNASRLAWEAYADASKGLRETKYPG